MEPTELEFGMVINYRGFPAQVIDVWTSQEDASGGFRNPVGAVIEWDDEQGRVQRCRLLWDGPRDEEGNLTGPLEVDGLNGPLELWEA